MTALERLTPTVISELRRAILDNHGHEIFAVGRLDRERKVYEIDIAARGNENAVPLLEPFLELGEVVIHNHSRGDLTPSGPDLAIASRLGNDGIGFFIIDNEVSSLNAVAEPVAKREIVPLDEERLAGLLMPGGRFSQIYQGYEQRTAQVEMLCAVCRSFNNEKVVMVEAGTGVGKSLAYIIPAVEWVRNNQERVVISTATINLQQQLLEKDIPLVMKIMEYKPKVALVKGRGNYLCLLRLNEAREEAGLFEEYDKEFEAIYEWSLTTQTGSRDDLSVYPSNEVWSAVCSEADACLGLRCRLRDECFVIKARKKAAGAQILVVNNHLLFSDLSVRLAGTGFKTSAVLPPFQRIIFDEAHNIEKSATSFFSEQFSRFALQKSLARLYRRKKGREFGLLTGLASREPDRTKIDKLKHMGEEVAAKGLLANTMAAGLLQDGKSLYIQGGPEQPPGEQALEQQLLDPLRELNALLSAYINAMDDLLESLPQADQDEDMLVLELKIQMRRLSRIADICGQFRKYKENREMIYWLDSFKSSGGERTVRFVITPLDITGVMKKAVYEPYASLVFTSATLTIVKDFRFWKTRVGLTDLPERELEELYLESPFNYREQVMLCVPHDAPMPSENTYQQFSQEMILKVIELFQGRALVLFTSYDMLNKTFEYVKNNLAQADIPILKQGDEDRARLLNNFVNVTNSALFATDSFWEGVDSPGETLSVVIICRLPFRVPTEPVTLARLAHIREQGGDPFRELSLPEAIMRFRQGFGRLMRSQKDRGVVLILDSRIVRKYYGQAFLDSLPETARSVVSQHTLLLNIENFMFA
jgi:ATP-dependent DNA helicase DinG